MERRHQEKKERLQVRNIFKTRKSNIIVICTLFLKLLLGENIEYQRRFLEEHNSRVQTAETKAEEQGRKVEDVQKLMRGLDLENTTLQEKLAANEAELEKLRGLKKTDSEDRSGLLFADPNLLLFFYT